MCQRQCDHDDPAAPGHHLGHTLPNRFASRLWRLAHPSHALAGTPPATREARATAEPQVIECTQERVDGVV